MAKAAVYNIKTKYGTTFKLNFTLKVTDSVPWDLTGYKARMQVRATAESSTKLLDLTDTSGITLGGASGTVDVEVLNLTVAPGRYVYDFEVESAGGEQWSILEGKFVVKANAVR